MALRNKGQVVNTSNALKMSVQDFWNELNSNVQLIIGGAELTARQRQVMEYLVGLSSDSVVLPTYEDAGKHFGVTRERIRAVESKSMEKLVASGFDSDIVYTYSHFLQLAQLIIFMDYLNKKSKNTAIDKS